MTKGKIGVTSENIFPIIKKFLYSEQDIFLRELVSNAVDACTKLQTIARLQENVGDIDNLRVTLTADSETNTLSISDNGIGMTAEEIDKYINQIAFSGAEDFLKKFESAGAQIIGHFGLGFYSAFMVADQVEIDTLSYQPGSKAVHWSCKGTPEFTLSSGTRKERGTTITLHLAEDSLKFKEKSEISTLLHKYCRFLPIPIIFGKKQEWKEGKYQDTEEDNIVNDVKPLWMQTPSSLTEDDYKQFYRDLYPGSPEPLFYIHLNVDYPFTLKGILYFPLIKERIDPQKNRIHLYCNQVFVTDQVEGVVPEWLYLLEGIIDSPDIPLNVSRSYLQQDANARKITAHIGKKVADALADLHKNNRKEYEDKWKGIGLFVHYGMLSDEKTYERLKPALLLEDIDQKLYTLEEFKALVGADQTDKDGSLVLLYATNVKEQYLSIQNATKLGYKVLLMDGPLSLPLIHTLEEKEEKMRFARIDSDTVARLIPKESSTDDSADDETRKLMEGLFTATQPHLEKAMITVQADTFMTENDSPVQLVSGEWMRRMKEMSKFQAGSGFYDDFPDSYILKVNLRHPLTKTILDTAADAVGASFRTLTAKVKEAEESRKELVDGFGEKSEDQLSSEEKNRRKELTDTIDSSRRDQQKLLEDYASGRPIFEELWDLGLLSAGLLEGERLQAYLGRREKNLLAKMEGK